MAIRDRNDLGRFFVNDRDDVQLRVGAAAQGSERLGEGEDRALGEIECNQDAIRGRHDQLLLSHYITVWP